MGLTGVFLILCGCLIILLLSGHLLGVALGVTGFVLLYGLVGAQTAPGGLNWVYHQFDSFVMTAIPLFVFMGEIVFRTGLGDMLYRGTSAWLRRIPGGLIQVNIGSCAIFAAVSGSSVATAATMGTVAYPEQLKRGYDSQLILGSLAGSGTLGLLIPPSIILLLYGALVGESVGKLFMGGVIPGIIMAIAFMIYIAIRCLLQPHLTPHEERVTLKTRLIAVRYMWPVGALIFFVLGGIYLGVVTPTEAAGLGAFIALVLAGLHRRLNLKVVRDALISTTRTVCMVMFVVTGALILQFGLGLVGVPRQMAQFILSLAVHRYVIMTGIYLLYLVLGCLFDGMSMMLLTLPVVYPAVMALGFDSVWFGVTLTLLIEIAQITPPVGLNLFVLHHISGRPLGEIIRGGFPFVLLLLGGIVLFTAYPFLILWLPTQMIS